MKNILGIHEKHSSKMWSGWNDGKVRIKSNNSSAKHSINRPPRMLLYILLTNLKTKFQPAINWTNVQIGIYIPVIKEYNMSTKSNNNIRLLNYLNHRAYNQAIWNQYQSSRLKVPYVVKARLNFLQQSSACPLQSFSTRDRRANWN